MSVMYICYTPKDRVHFETIQALCSNPQSTVECVDCHSPFLSSEGHARLPLIKEIKTADKLLVLVSEYSAQDDWFSAVIEAFTTTQKSPDVLFMRIEGNKDAALGCDFADKNVVNWNKLKLIYWMENQSF
ncbi:hypothetical protein CS022_23340 [Veronia nyctiphanis]|uniref:TIR domain-containing protein n=1 Tax=Veronia nyctiphanis TaxID=1278244 RepID=A0A4Q0YI81_9GAMM|nr:hypothetical protein [Veronia nyctiphanis]RXJ70412.1 hypothetical protein CS022_23340 [Veronia nyctiphanis]